MRWVAAVLCVAMVAGLCPHGWAQDATLPDAAVDAKERDRIIDRIVRQLNRDYVFPEVAEAMGARLEEKRAAGDYDAIDSTRQLCDTLTEDLRAVSQDRHLRVRFQEGPRRDAPREREEPAEEVVPFNQSRYRNHGFAKVERLPGNIGYLELLGFHGVNEESGATAAAAMNFLSNSDAVIVDLRRNGGGAPGMVAFLCSYFFDTNPVHLNSLYYRPSDSTQQWWTLPHVPGKRMPDVPLYILTSDYTFSAAEEFTYNLQSLGRATIVGETTGGGAHPGGTRNISRHVQLWLPTGRAINPVTGTNWEGTGVVPDIACAAEDALETAQRVALEGLRSDAGNAARRALLDDTILALELEG